MAKLPAFQFYPGDWRKDPELARASKAEKGMLIDILCLMHEAEDRGTLATSREPWSDEDIAAAAGGDLPANLVLLHGLLRKGILRRNTSGAVFSARMVRDEQARQQAQRDGAMGGNPELIGGLRGGVKGGVKPKPTPQVKPKPTPSSSVSPSTSSSESKEPPATPVARVQKHFADKLLAHQGPEARMNYAHLGKLAKTRLAQMPEEEVLRRIDNWFASSDPWVVSNINNVGVMDGKFHILKSGPIQPKGGQHGKPENGFRTGAGGGGKAHEPDPAAVIL